MIGGGVRAGASTPCHGAVLKSFTPASGGVGTAGGYGTRPLPDVPSTLTRPLFNCAMIVGGVVKMSCTSFWMSAVSAGAPPLKGTDVMRVSVASLKTSAAIAPELLGVAHATLSEFGFAFASLIKSP